MRVRRATLALVLVGGIGLVAFAQSRPTGTGPLKSYHIRPGDLPPPGTGTANPPQVVPRPAGAQLTLPPGFAIHLFAEGGFQTLRWAMEGPGCEIFVTDTTANVNHCGGCGVVCAATEVCSAGTCIMSCLDPTTNCGGRCVDRAGRRVARTHGRGEPQHHRRRAVLLQGDRAPSVDIVP